MMDISGLKGIDVREDDPRAYILKDDAHSN